MCSFSSRDENRISRDHNERGVGPETDGAASPAGRGLEEQVSSQVVNMHQMFRPVAYHYQNPLFCTTQGGNITGDHS